VATCTGKASHVGSVGPTAVTDILPRAGVGAGVARGRESRAHVVREIQVSKRAR
jgi:hypothetical protein